VLRHLLHLKPGANPGHNHLAEPDTTVANHASKSKTLNHSLLDKHVKYHSGAAMQNLAGMEPAIRKQRCRCSSCCVVVVVAVELDVVVVVVVVL
jgi:hypothetical protein